MCSVPFKQAGTKDSGMQELHVWATLPLFMLLNDIKIHFLYLHLLKVPLFLSVSAAHILITELPRGRFHKQSCNGRWS